MHLDYSCVRQTAVVSQLFNLSIQINLLFHIINLKLCTSLLFFERVLLAWENSAKCFKHYL